MMATECSAAERCRAVRLAARGWESAGFLGGEARSVIDRRYADDRVRLPVGFRVLAFLLTLVAVLAAFGFLVLIGDGGGEAAAAALAAVFAVLCALGTEVQRGRFRRADAGAELATALLTLVFAAIAIVIWAGIADAPLAVALGLLALLAAALAARWGTGILGLITAVLVFGWLAQFEAGRLLWIAAAALALQPLLAGSRHPALAPGHRHGCWLAAAVAVTALCLAVNLVSWDERWLEGLRLSAGTPGAAPAGVPRLAALAATAVVPLLLLAAGWRRRELLLVGAGIAGIAVSLATFDHYRPLLPPAWLAVAGGTVLVGAALGWRRWLRGGAGGERHGWTADGLFTDDSRTAVVKDVIGSLAFTPDARAGAAPERTGDGRFGGGGASGNY